MAKDAELGFTIDSDFVAINRAYVKELMNVVEGPIMPSGPITIIGNP